MPNIIDNSDGAFRRIYVTKWENQFLPGGDMIDNYALMILDNEKNGIFNMMLENYKSLMNNGGFRYKQSIAYVREKIKLESDKLREFIDINLVKKVNSYIIKDQFYEVYQKFCEENNYEIFSKQKIGAVLPTYGFIPDQKKINKKNYRVWLNFSWHIESNFIKKTILGLDQYE